MPPREHDQSADHDDADRSESKSPEREDRLRFVVDGARDFALIMLDPQGRIATWSVGAERLFGVEESEAVGRDIAMIFTPEERAAGISTQALATAERDGRAEDERWHVRKDQSRFWGSGVMTASRDPSGALRGFVRVIRDETARKRAEQALEAARDAAERANRIKDDFLARLSHELRTPLASILIWSKLLSARATPESQATEGLHAIMRSAESQKQLIDDLVDISRITSNNLRIEVRPVELARLVPAAIDTIMPTALRKGIQLQVGVGDDVGTVLADPNRLTQVLWNLLSNAVKFTPEGGRVDIALTRRGCDVELQVQDTGIGIDGSFLPLAFEPFQQADSGASRAHGGLGLGLAIARQLVEQHGGTISAKSPGRGLGATFVARLPLPAIGGHDPAPALEAQSARELLRVKVLVVEDEPETRAALTTALEAVGAQVMAVASADAALATLQGEAFDVVVSDIAMPGMDGCELIRRIRTAGDSRLRAIALSASVRDDDRAAALAAGFDLHIAKPVEPARLTAAVLALLG